MNPFPRCQRAAGLLAVVFVLAACSTTSQQEVAADTAVEPPANFFVGSTDVFAHLDTASGGSWVFTKVTDSDVQPAKGYLVRLNDLAPAFDTRVAECEPQNYPVDHRCSPVNPFRNKDAGVFDKIISGSIAAGTAGKVTDISRTYETSFDEAAFNQAVDEALINTGLDVDRKELLTALATYDQLVVDGRAARAGLVAELDAIDEDTSSVPLDIQIVVSGVAEYYSDDIDLRRIIELIPGRSSLESLPAIERVSLLPCDPRQCIRTVREATAAARAELENLDSLSAAVGESRQSVYDVRCESTSYAGYRFVLECPATVMRSGNETVVLPVSLRILARDFDGLYPRVEIADENLEVDIDEDSVAFTNRSSDYVSVKAHTVYYNSQVHTTAASLTVAPGATVEKPISEFISPAITVESSYRNMTPDKASSATFQFGFATKYRVAGETSDTTLFERNTFNVGCAIADRVTPGSCEHAQSRAARQSPGSSY